jgi:ethanolamine utilization protein EutP (predicted NTPase)
VKHQMTEDQFVERVNDLLRERGSDKIFALDLGRRFRELCAEYLETNANLPKGFEAFE